MARRRERRVAGGGGRKTEKQTAAENKPARAGGRGSRTCEMFMEQNLGPHMEQKAACAVADVFWGVGRVWGGFGGWG